MSEDTAFIAGIHNYCDRWCERCPFVSRCRVGVAERESGALGEEADMRNAAFWERMGAILSQAKQMLEEMARERGIDLDEAVAQAAARPRKRRSANGLHREALRQAKRYPKMVDAWFEANEQVFRRRGLDLASAARMGLKGVDPIGEAGEIKDAVEVIRWYSAQIYAKLRRALEQEPEMEDDPEFAEFAQNDADGSAKVALIGMDRSLAAWGRLYDQLPDAQDGILNILLHLDRLRRATESLFPNARAFVRPGFDEPV